MKKTVEADHASASLRRVRRLANTMDSAFRIPGTQWRIGVDALVGLIPGVGDAASAAASAWIILEARRIGVPKRTQWRMLGNLLLDTVIGSIPLFGDLFDAGYKANVRNADLIERHIQRYKK